MARRKIDDFDLDEDKLRKEQELHQKVGAHSAHKPSLSGQAHSDEAKVKKKPGPKPKFTDKKVQLNFSGVPEPVKLAFDTFSKNLKLTDSALIELGKKDVLLLALANYGIPIPDKYLPDVPPSKDNRDNATISTNRDIDNNKDN